MTDKKAVEIAVNSEDPKRASGDVTKKNGKEETKLSEEDLRIKEQVELLVTRAGDSDSGIACIAVEQLADLLRTSSSGSVASVPKPLKFIRSLYSDLEVALKNAHDATLMRRLHDVLSFVSMTMDMEQVRHVTLEHKLKGTQDDLAQWGHEYLRFLAAGIADDWKEHAASNESTLYLSSFVDQVIKYMTAHQDEPTAIDLLMEIGEIQRILPLVDEANYKRIANYVTAVTRYLTRPDDTEVLRQVYELYVRMGDYSSAATTALQLGENEKLVGLFAKCESKATRLQIALSCARKRVFLDIGDDDELLQEANGNMRLSHLYRHSAQALDAMAPQAPDAILKSSGTQSWTSKNPLYNLTSAFVSGLANCGYGKDEYLTANQATLFDQREDRIISTTAAQGLLHLWDHTEGLQELDKFMYSDSKYVKAGACLASGIVMNGIQSPFDPALGILGDLVSSEQQEVSIGAILGIGYAYAGTRREDIKDTLTPYLVDSNSSLDVRSMCAYALAMVFVGSADEDITETMVNTLLEIPEARLKDACVRYLILALGCMFLRCQEKADTLLDATQALSPLIRRYVDIVVRSCAYAATGDVLTIQKFFHIITENEEKDDHEGNHEEDDEEGDKKKDEQQPINHKAVAVLGIGLVAVGEELGMEMAKRAIIHVLLADTVSKEESSMSGRRAVPLVYALLSASNPSMSVVETLNRLAHDADRDTASNAVLAMGVVSAGSNNARAAGKLRSLAQYYQRDNFAPISFVVRLSQGLCAMGKGHLTLSPLQDDGQIVCPSALMGLLGLLHSALDMDKTILDKYHYMLFSIVPSIAPRMVLAVNEEMEPLKDVQVRVGLPVDVVALPGKPKSITGFQTNSTPVLLSSTDRVEVSDSKFRPIPSIIEGIFVVEEKPVVD